MVIDGQFRTHAAEAGRIGGGCAEREVVPDGFNLPVGVAIQNRLVCGHTIGPSRRHDGSRTKRSGVSQVAIEPPRLKSLIGHQQVDSLIDLRSFPIEVVTGDAVQALVTQQILLGKPGLAIALIQEYLAEKELDSADRMKARKLMASATHSFCLIVKPRDGLNSSPGVTCS